MASDCTVCIDDGFINIRVGAIIMNGRQFLMVGNDRADYLYSVGGRIRFGETAEQAVKREVYEETGMEMEVDRLGFIHEHFFYGDSKRTKNKLIYEVSYFFYMKTPERFELKCDSFGEDDSREKLVWITTDSDIQFYPEFFKTELNKPEKFIKHIVTDERKSSSLVTDGAERFAI